LARGWTAYRLSLFQVLVDGEEVFDLVESVALDVSNIPNVIEPGIPNGDCDDHPGRAHLSRRPDHIQWSSVVRKGAGNEAIICQVMNGRVEDAVKPEDAGTVVIFILIAASLGNLDKSLNDSLFILHREPPSEPSLDWCSD
jgi:hypothetical protein